MKETGKEKRRGHKKKGGEERGRDASRKDEEEVKEVWRSRR